MPRKTLQIKDLAAGEQYAVQVRALGDNETFNSSNWSLTLQFTTDEDVIAPEAPNNLAVVVDGASFVATWTEPTQNDDGSFPVEDLKDYEVTIRDVVADETVTYYTTNQRFEFTYEMNRAAFGSTASGITDIPNFLAKRIEFSLKSRDLAHNTSETPAVDEATNGAPGAFTLTDNEAESPLTSSLSWDTPSGNDILVYRVRRGVETGVYDTAKTTNDTNFTESNLPRGQYFYIVEAYDRFGNMTATNEVSVTVKGFWEADFAVPDNPTISNVGSTFDAGTETSDLTFDITGPTTADGGDVSDYDYHSHYVVRWSTSQTGPFQHQTIDETDNTATHSVSIQGLQPNTVYYYGVKSVSEYGQSGAFETGSTTTDEDTSAPAAPANLTAAGSLKNITASWDANSEPDLAYYELYANQTSGFDPLVDGTKVYTGNGTGFAHSVGDNETWYYKVRAVDTSDNDSDFSTEASATSTGAVPEEDTTPPSDVTNPAVSAQTYYHGSSERAYADVSWTAATDNVDITAYIVAYRESAGTWTELVGSGDSTDYRVTDLQPGVEYEFRIKAQDAAGNRSTNWSTTVSDTATSDSDVTPDDVVLNEVVSESPGTLRADWQSVTNVPIRGYIVQVDGGGSGFPDPQQFDVDSSRIYLSGVTGSTYHVRVKAVDEFGVESSNWSNVLSAQVESVGTNDLDDGAVTTAKLVDDAVDGTKLADLSVDTSHLVDDAVSGIKIVDNAITETKISDDSISTPKLQANSVTANEVAANTITASEIAASTITASEIAASTITANEIAGNTITAAELAANTITAGEIAADTLTASEIAANAITADEIAANAVTANKLNVVIGGGNLLPNSSFEDGQSSWSGAIGIDDVIDDTVFRSGSQSWRWDGTGASGEKFAVNTTQIFDSVDPGEPLTLTIYARTDSDTEQYVSLSWRDSGGFGVGTPTDGVAKPSSSTGWTRHTVTGVAPSGAASVYVEVYTTGPLDVGESIWWDDAQLESGDVATSYAPKTDEVLPGTIVAPMIQAGQIDTDHIDVIDLSADSIFTGSLQADRITVGGGTTYDSGYDPSTKAKTFYQSSEPTAEGVGDIWFDTDDDNKQYRWDGSDWQEVLHGANSLDVSVGGGNLLNNSSAEGGTNAPWAFQGATVTTVVDDPEAPHGEKVWKGSAGGSGNYRLVASSGGLDGKIRGPVTVVLSQHVYWPSSNNDPLPLARFMLRDSVSGNNVTNSQPIPSADAWHRVYSVIEVPDDGNEYNQVYLGFNGGDTSTDEVYVDALQLEYGDVVTAYAPKAETPEGAQAKADAAEAAAEATAESYSDSIEAAIRGDYGHVSDTTLIDGGSIFTGTVDADVLVSDIAITNGLRVQSLFELNTNGFIRSENYVAGTSGFSLDNNSFELYGDDSSDVSIIFGTTGLNLNTATEQIWFGSANFGDAGTTWRVDTDGSMRVGGDGSFYADAAGNIWSGDSVMGNAPWEITAAGAARFDNIKITGDDVSDGQQVMNVGGEFIITRTAGNTAQVDLAGTMNVTGNVNVNGGNITLTSGDLRVTGGDVESSDGWTLGSGVGFRLRGADGILYAEGAQIDSLDVTGTSDFGGTMTVTNGSTLQASNGDWEVLGDGSATFSNVTIDGGTLNIGPIADPEFDNYNFQVTSSGVLSAKGATIQGGIQATDGWLQNLDITGLLNIQGDEGRIEIDTDGVRAYDDPSSAGNLFFDLNITENTGYFVGQVSIAEKSVEDNENLSLTSTAVGTAEYDTSSQTINDLDDVWMSPDGTKLFVSERYDQGGLGNGGNIYTYTLTRPWEVTSASFDGSWHIGTTATILNFVLSPDGTKIVFIGNNGIVRAGDLATPFDLSTTTVNASEELDVSATYTDIEGIELSRDGTVMYLVDSTGDQIAPYDLSTAWDPSTGTAGTVMDVSTESTNPQGVRFDDTGTIAYLVDNTGPAEVYRYNLSTPWDLSTASVAGSKDVSSVEPQPLGIALDSSVSGYRYFIVGMGTQDIHQYDFPIDVPFGLGNSQKRTLTSDGDWNDGVSTDANGYDQWAAGSGAGNGVAAGNYFEIDLQEVKDVAEMRVAWYGFDARSYWYKIMYSVDGVNWHNAKGSSGTDGWARSRQNDELDMSTDESGHTVDRFNPRIRAKYIRIYGDGSTANPNNHVFEVEIYPTYNPDDLLTVGRNFSVDRDGNMYANNGIFNGTVYATDGEFTGTITGSTIIGGEIEGATFRTAPESGARLQIDTGGLRFFSSDGTTAKGGIDYDYTSDFLDIDATLVFFSDDVQADGFNVLGSSGRSAGVNKVASSTYPGLFISNGGVGDLSLRGKSGGYTLFAGQRLDMNGIGVITAFTDTIRLIENQSGLAGVISRRISSEDIIELFANDTVRFANNSGTAFLTYNLGAGTRVVDFHVPNSSDLYLRANTDEYIRWRDSNNSYYFYADTDYVNSRLVAGEYWNSSDARKKTNRAPVSADYRVLDISVEDWTNETPSAHRPNERRRGFIAQDIQEKMGSDFPGVAVLGGEDEDNDSLGVDYNAVLVTLIPVIKDLHLRIEELEARLARGGQ